MKFKKIGQDYLLAFYRGDYLLASLNQFCQQKKINNGFFFGLGAVDEAELAHYSVAKKKYTAKKFIQPLEMVSLIGNVFLGEKKELIIHSHAVFGKSDFSTISGHLLEAKIAGVGEVIFFPFKTQIGKKYDQETGLKIITNLKNI